MRTICFYHIHVNSSQVCFFLPRALCDKFELPPIWEKHLKVFIHLHYYAREKIGPHMVMDAICWHDWCITWNVLQPLCAIWKQVVKFLILCWLRISGKQLKWVTIIYEYFMFLRTHCNSDWDSVKNKWKREIRIL